MYSSKISEPTTKKDSNTVRVTSHEPLFRSGGRSLLCWRDFHWLGNDPNV